MTDPRLAYWEETIRSAAEECGTALTEELIGAIAVSVQVAHENYGMGSYSPSPGDRTATLKAEYELRLSKMQHDFDKYRASAEKAVQNALDYPRDINVRILDDGFIEVES